MTAHTVNVISNEQVTDRYCVLTIEKPEGFTFLPGQFVMLQMPGGKIKRAFSIASAPYQGHLEFFVKKQERGKLSPRLYALSARDKLVVSGPFGKFTMDKPTPHVYLIGAGSGMAPLMSMARAMAHVGTQPFTVICGSSYANEFVYRDELLTFAQSVYTTVHFCTSREKVAGCLEGRTTDHLQAIAIKSDADAYICGPPDMVDDTVVALRDVGFTEEQQHTEKYD